MALSWAMSSAVRVTSRNCPGALAHQAGDHGSRAALPRGDDPHGLVEHDSGQDMTLGDLRDLAHLFLLPLCSRHF